MQIFNKYSGFTIVELIIIIAIISVFASIAIPNFLSYMPKTRLNGAARQVMGDLMAARMKAVKFNHRTKVFFYSEHEYRICNDANNDETVDSYEGDVQLRDIQNEYSDVRFDLANTADPVFSSRGSATPKTITLQNSSGSKTITISIAGRVQIN